MHKGSHMGKLLWVFLVSFTSLLLLGSGCRLRGGPSDKNALRGAPEPEMQTVDQSTASNLITKDYALDAVRKQPLVVQYEEALKAKGYQLFMGVQETPSRFIVRVGEQRAEKVTFVRWYLVDRNDGLVTEWKISDGEPPPD